MKALTKFFKITLGKKIGIPGMVVAIQSFGDYARFHPHLHALVADGLFLESGYFFVMPKADLKPLREIFRALLKHDTGDSSVIYRSKMSHRKNKRNFQVFSP
ncbi:MAG: hypothetical protein GY702_28900, partial [Desulfobulbaceae bacterium]|nr:hypothetical protein [Desulfobulbaceae bacterium]